MPTVMSKRVFKTAKFNKDAQKAGIPDTDLCKAIRQVFAGQCDDLGGGVYKKRLNDNMHRSIILAKGGRYWVYEYLFAKKSRDNIEDDELNAFRSLAKTYSRLTDVQIAALVSGKDIVEICHDDKAQV